MNYRSLIFLALLFLQTIIFAQDSTKSEAYRNTPTEPEYPLIKRTAPRHSMASTLWMRDKAAEGDPVYQHNLGLMYLLGEGFEPDTAKAIYWENKAAGQNYIPAIYNMGIFYLNGAGVEWDPFRAYSLIQTAAQGGMKEAQFVFGLFYLENLVVSRDIKTAYHWIKKAAEVDYGKSKELLADLEEQHPYLNLDGEETSGGVKYNEEGYGALNYNYDLDYYQFGEDTTEEGERSMLKEVFSMDAGKLEKAFKIEIDSSEADTVNATRIIAEAAKEGNPEALLVTGKARERGEIFKKDLLAAATNYIRAFRLGSQTAAQQLFRLIWKKGFIENLYEEARKDNPDALYTLAVMSALNYIHNLPEEEALAFLKKAASKNHIPSIIELGYCYHSGALVEQDREKSMEYWKQAAELGSIEAAVRVALSKAVGENPDMQSVLYIFEAAEEGSVPAMAAAGYLYEKGYGVEADKAQAEKFYRLAASRGNDTAAKGLEKLYDSIRPEEERFVIERL